ncbi:hypothetical protein PIB30_027249 [Stylosanthes scabra]|uniref:Uncharacterized protein n=1 Tax=Stylosanthes scabra TaxID=79078 RepID=A0ABU6VAF4_9FABA|nr:hypothetical protein [Stylosanthes scabra]
MATPTNIPFATVEISSEKDATADDATDSIRSFTGDSQAIPSSHGEVGPRSRNGGWPSAKVAGSRRAMRRRLRGFHRELTEIRGFMQKQDKINTEMISLLRQTTMGQLNSPMVDSSSPVAMQSGAKGGSPSIPKGNPGRTPLKTYKRRMVNQKLQAGKRLQQVDLSKGDQSGSDDCVFYFTRSNNRKGKMLVSKGSCSKQKGKRALFVTHNKAVCIPPLEKDYVSSSSDRCRMYAEA